MVLYHVLQTARVKRCVLVAMLLLPVLAHSQIFSCRDKQGRYLTSDHPLPECSNVPVNELTKSGLIRREIPAPLTAEQRRQKDQDDEKARQNAAVKELQMQQDRALLARYRSEDDIESARMYYLGLTHDLIKRDEMAQSDAQSDLDAVNQESQFYKDKNALPLQMKTRMNNAKAQLIQTQQSIARHQKDLSEINGKFDAIRVRYRDLVTRMAAEPPR